MRALITGGAGFIGSNFIRMLLAERPDWQIVNFDLLTYAGNLESLADLQSHPHYTFFKGDIAEPDEIEKAFHQPIDMIVNFAAETHVDRSLYDSSAFLRANVAGIGILLELALKNGVGKFIQISTDEVYGSISSPGKADEGSHLRPSSPYAASKAAADLLCMSFYKTHQLPVLITRSGNNYGPYQFPEKVIPLFITNAVAGKHLPLYGRGENIRNWIHVRDNCRAILRIAESGAIGEIYNIGSDDFIDNLSLARIIVKAMDCPESLIKFVHDRPGHDLRYAVDWSKLGALGWTPEIPFDTGLIQTVKWYLANKKWWQNILSGERLRFYEQHYKNR